MIRQFQYRKNTPLLKKNVKPVKCKFEVILNQNTHARGVGMKGPMNNHRKEEIQMFVQSMTVYDCPRLSRANVHGL